MRLVIAGAHGQVGLRLGRLPITRRDTVVGVLRNPDHPDDLHAAGAEPAVDGLGTGRVALADRVPRGHVTRDGVADQKPG